MIKITRLITNQIIIGYTQQNNETVTIKNPYVVIPEAQGIQMYPFDEAIIGNVLESIDISLLNILYSTPAGTLMKDTYLEHKTGIEIPKLILG